MTADLTATDIIAEALAAHDGHCENVYDDFYACACGEWDTDIVAYDERKAAHVAHQASAVTARLVQAGHTIVTNDLLRELVGPSREVDNCPSCDETVAWERSDYDLRDNDDDRYSWRAYCETCNLDLEMIPYPNPPLAAAASATTKEKP